MTYYNHSARKSVAILIFLPFVQHTITHGHTHPHTSATHKDEQIFYIIQLRIGHSVSILFGRSNEETVRPPDNNDAPQRPRPNKHNKENVSNIIYGVILFICLVVT